jgi:hypothetical protein
MGPIDLKGKYMNRIESLIIILLVLIVNTYSQNRDSLLQDLYQKGLISKDLYYRSISKEAFLMKEQPKILDVEGQ